MGWSAAAVVITSALMVGEGVWFLRHGEPPVRARRWGLLLLVVAGWSLIWARLFFLGRMVVSPELGVLMAQGGPVTGLGLGLLLGGIALGAGIAWGACHCHEGCRPSFRWWLMGGALGMGLVTALQLQPLQMEEPGLPRIYSYDLWSPPLLLWLCLCLAGSILGLLQVRSRLSLVWFTTVLVTALALFAEGRAEYTGSELAEKWDVAWSQCLMLALPASMGLAAWLASWGLQLRSRGLRGVIRSLLVVALAGLGGRFVVMEQQTRSLWGAFAVIAVALAALRAWKRLATYSPDIPPLRRYLALAAVMLLPLSVVVPLRSTSFNPLVDLAGLMLGWGVLADALLEGPLSRQLRALREATSTPGRTALWAALQGLTAAGRRLRAWSKQLFSLPSFPIALAKLLVALVLIIALGEIPNAGKTIIQPFRDTGIAPADEKALGQSVSDNLLSAIGALRKELRPEGLLLQPAGGDEPEKQRQYSGRGLDTGDSTTVFTTDMSLDVGSIKVPIHLLIAPIQTPVRALLGVRVIQGTLHEDQSRYTLLAASNTGETWTVSLSKQELVDDLPQGPDGPVEPRPTDAIVPLTQQLAFEIISADPQYEKTGITHSWRAFQAFQQGMRDWESVERGQDWDAITRAIEAFREATRLDPGFALAYYRLGLTLRADGQHSSATEALRQSITRNPSFVPGQVALAFQLHAGGGDSLRETVASPPAPVLMEGPREEQRRNARELWRQIIQVPDPAHLMEKAQAYHGLCLLDAAEVARASSSHPRATQWQRRAYFYCKRAERTYARLSRVSHAAPLVKEETAQVLGTLGRLLKEPGHELHGRFVGMPWRPDPRYWLCSSTSLNEGDLMWQGVFEYELVWSPHLRAARQYFERAAELSKEPEADMYFQCEAAMAAKALGEEEPMQLLKGNALAHLVAAQEYSAIAKQTVFEENGTRELIDFYHLLALHEFQWAVELDPSNVTALNGYAYTFWQWRYHVTEPAVEDIALHQMSHRAEAFARKAVTLAKSSGSRALQVQTQSTLGELLLALARPSEAIEVLSEAQRHAFTHPLFDEVHWDLAQAYLCEALNEELAGLEKEASLEEEAGLAHRVQELRRRATQLFKDIHQHDLSREDKLFSGQNELELPPTLDPNRVSRVCLEDQRSRVEALPEGTRPVFVLRGGEPQYESNGLCDWLGIQADANTPEGGPVHAPLLLHVWGGGIDIRVPVTEVREEHALLAYEPRNTRDYYFAQLEDKDQQAVSAAYAIPTFANTSTGRCAKNQLNLTFDQQGG
jgi:tetratricopeptide (TPR) repeat protein